eukprot:m.31420 g.31420  ORF g.31420 m.31420 type:complete len:316 (+) comp13974_c0_seq2:410-1357(+)
MTWSAGDCVATKVLSPSSSASRSSQSCSVSLRGTCSWSAAVVMGAGWMVGSGLSVLPLSYWSTCFTAASCVSTPSLTISMMSTRSAPAMSRILPPSCRVARSRTTLRCSGGVLGGAFLCRFRTRPNNDFRCVGDGSSSDGGAAAVDPAPGVGKAVESKPSAASPAAAVIPHDTELVQCWGMFVMRVCLRYCTAPHRFRLEPRCWWCWRCWRFCRGARASRTYLDAAVHPHHRVRARACLRWQAVRLRHQRCITHGFVTVGHRKELSNVTVGPRVWLLTTATVFNNKCCQLQQSVAELWYTYSPSHPQSTPQSNTS